MEGITVVCPYTSCNDCCIVHSTCAGADPELVGGVVVGVACCCCILFCLALILVLTFAPCTLTLEPCACGRCHQQLRMVVVFLPRPLAQRLHLHPRQFHPLQLASVVFFLPPTGAYTELTLKQLALCSAVFWWWWWW